MSGLRCNEDKDSNVKGMIPFLKVKLITLGEA